MVSRLLFWISIAASAVILLSFAMFATDEVRGASNQSAVESGGVITQSVEVARDSHGRRLGHTPTRRHIDSVSDTLTAPVTWVVHSENPWAMRGIACLFGLLFWGVGVQWASRAIDLQRAADHRPAHGQ